ncbi:hypothetical protein Tco_1029962 [Tanacetum coccineum]|uniref:Homologous recombination OB-fold protein OB-fold domain-containing protein n=1 Tax=Tanacetum coccineum TaxID=301880 RepID=A0ABQ5G5G0_9ASTR
MPEQIGVREFSPPYYISQLKDSLIISGSFGDGDCRIIYAWALEVEGGSQAKLLKENVFILGSDGALKSTQEYMQKVVEDVGCLGDIKNFLKNRKLDQVVTIVKSCSPNAIGDLTVTMKDLIGTIPGTIHYKVIGEGGYGKDITVGAGLILANVSIFSPKPSMHYLNITLRNIVKVFCKDTVPQIIFVLILRNVSVFTPKPSKHYLNITIRNIVKVFDKDTEF